jgi:hypothetical protein
LKRAFLAFFGTLLLLTATSWMLVGVFVVGDLPGGWRTLALLWTLSVAPLIPFVGNLLRHGYPSAFLRTWIYRIFWYTQLNVLVLVPVTVAAFLVGLLFGAGPEGGRLAVLAGVAVEVVVAIVGYFGTRSLVVKQLSARIPNLPAGLDGLRIVQLADLHIGPHTPRAHLDRIVEATARAEPHLIAYTGDQVDDYPRDMEVFAAHLGGLKSPLGVFAIAGNHDVYAGWTEVRRGLERMGTTVLVNRAVPLRHNGVEFWVAGTGDPAATAFAQGPESPVPDIARTLAGIPADAFHVVLAHNPALWPALAARGAPLTLSGHTHHGQFAIPALNWCLASPFLTHAMGAYESNGALLYISAGANYWGIPFRIGCPPEVTVLTLRPATNGPAIDSRASDVG